MMAARTSGGAGDYYSRVIWYQHSTSADTSNGQMTDVYTDNGNLWCYTVEEKPKQEVVYGALNHTTKAKIHLRGYPDVGQKDRFKDLFHERIYQVEAITYDFALGETVVNAYFEPSQKPTV